MLKVTFQLRQRGGLFALTQRYPDLKIFDYCNLHAEFCQLRTKNQGELKKVVRDFLASRKKSGFVMKRVMIENEAAAFVTKCNHEKKGDLTETMHKHSCMPLFPTVYDQGWLKVNGICFDESRLPALLYRLSKWGEIKLANRAKIEYDMLKDYFMIPTGALTAHLTAKQAESLLTAVDLGYYQVPRKTKFEEIAKSANVSKATYEEHVRKAENKIITAAAPYLSLFFGRAEKNRMIHVKRNPVGSLKSSSSTQRK